MSKSLSTFETVSHLSYFLICSTSNFIYNFIAFDELESFFRRIVAIFTNVFSNVCFIFINIIYIRIIFINILLTFIIAIYFILTIFSISKNCYRFDTMGCILPTLIKTNISTKTNELAIFSY